MIWDQEVVGSNPTSPILFKNSSNKKTIDFSLMRRVVILRKYGYGTGEHFSGLFRYDLVKNSEWCRLRGRCTENSFLWVAADGW